MKNLVNRLAGISWERIATDLRCGRKDKFGRFFADKIQAAILDAQVFSKVALVTDRDDRQEEDITAEVCRIFAPAITHAKQNHWVENAYQDGFGQNQTLSCLLRIIPPNQQGALESRFLEGISGNGRAPR